MSEPILANRSEQSDFVRLFSDVEIDARDVAKIFANLVSLKKKMTAIIVTRSRSAWVAGEDQVSVFVGLSLGRFDGLGREIVQVAELGDDAGRILQGVRATHQEFQRIVGSDGGLRMSTAGFRLCNRGRNGSDAALSKAERRSHD